ncbi:MAG: ferrous iron transport protein B [Bacteroidetes bacterium]|nr:ferrous iron transport protein B [Bacteroidota bacterium]MBU1423710.1 ferrous iron transport protein B [Bacteroidota bacterium]MBU2471691.1 ferrous iron transport protein B [Bacteroidota bacterium]MBU2635874.1 ferrous iron transport protein B [Bacteroidota bacterium]
MKNNSNAPTHLEHHVHIGEVPILSDSASPKIVLVGNPNVGKSVIFNYLSGIYVDVSNYPGTTVEVTKGKYLQYDVYDTPGIYGVSSFNDEERVARDIILEGDVIINIVDGVHMERDLFLTQQLIDMGKRLLVVINFWDEVNKHRIKIDIGKLEHFLGVPVITATAVKKEGLKTLEEKIQQARQGKQNRQLHSKLHIMLTIVGSQSEALLVLEGDEFISKNHGVAPLNERESVYIDRRNRVNYIVNQIIEDDSTRKHIYSLIGRWTVRTITGIPILIGILYLMFLFVGKLVAQDLVGFTETYLGNELWEVWIRSVVTGFIPATSLVAKILVGEFGVLTMSVTYLLFLLFPLVFAFYIALSLLEDSGYLPRLATMVDRSMIFIGLNGRAVIPLILGFGCVSMATITTRLLSTEREKTIATTILQFAIPCSAQLAVITALLVGAGFQALLIYTAVIFSVLVTIGTVLNKTLKGESSPLLIDLPPMRLPRINNVFQKTVVRTFSFMKEAAPWFFLGAGVIGTLEVTGLLKIWQQALAPLTVHWLKLPADASTAFVMGLVRRDFGAAGLYSLHLDPMQVVVALVTITLFVPCVTSMIIMYKERGWKKATLIWIGTWLNAFLIGGLVAHIIGIFKIL